MTFFPEGETVPSGLRTNDLVLRMLGPDVVEPDYEAIMETRERLRLWSDSDWPTDDFTLADNLGDMHMHADEHLAKEAFAFTVLSADESRVEGCCYFQPLGGLLQRREIVSQEGQEPLSDSVATVGFWVRDSALPRDFDRQLLEGLARWLAEDWPFERAMFLTNDSQPRDHQILREMGLPLTTTLRSHDSGLEWQLWEIPVSRS
jgi:hypothetical protein